jgi:hypothetical protein
MSKRALDFEHSLARVCCLFATRVYRVPNLSTLTVGELATFLSVNDACPLYGTDPEHLEMFFDGSKVPAAKETRLFDKFADVVYIKLSLNYSMSNPRARYLGARAALILPGASFFVAIASRQLSERWKIRSPVDACSV